MTERVKKYLENCLSRDLNHSIASLNEVKKIKDFSAEEKIHLADGLSALFFQEFGKIEDTAKIARLAESTIASFGTDISDWLINQLMESDPESAKNYARVLSQSSNKSINKAIEILSSDKIDESVNSNLIIGFGYCEDENAIKGLDVIIKNVNQLKGFARATAIQALGRIIVRLTNKLTSDQRKIIFTSAQKAISDTNVKVRMQAVRTIGKMVRYSILNDEQIDQAHKIFRTILGMDNFEWDNAYVVRHEAETALHYCQGGKTLTKSKGSVYQQDYKIVMRKELMSGMVYFRVHAPLIAKKIEAGQFIIIRPDEKSERIPISIAGWDREAGYLEIIISAVGRTSREAVSKKEGDSFTDVVGPLGQRSHVKKQDGTCVVIGGGYGTGAVIPTARDLKALGNRVIGVVGARSKELLIMVEELKSVCDEVVVTTNDGSLGTSGMVTDGLKLIMSREKVSYVLAVGPVPMMKALSEMTKADKIETWVSLNAIMVDGTGMCGACRVTVDGKTRFACFHGPDFDGHKVNFEELVKRQKMFMKLEQQAAAI
ncbi:MAG: sulfide/dihydroorotate dehydrogenase-like FAD/NAD-binding protein [Spirochaetia bacterium]|nr:sulfide/dihydroorotate dehydrogenase-like FAD/NAD-binding protein [Spirochaetia bacterium]